jgi:hypothetical protein
MLRINENYNVMHGFAGVFAENVAPSWLAGLVGAKDRIRFIRQAI